MATYGLNGTGTIVATGWTPTLNAGPANVPGPNPTIYFNGVSQNDARFTRIFRNGTYGKRMRQLYQQLTGAIAGGNADARFYRVQGVTGGPFGNVPIERVGINRATTAGDIAALQGMVNRNTYPSVYPPDLSGNGGGGKVKY